MTPEQLRRAVREGVRTAGGLARWKREGIARRSMKWEG